MVGGKWSRESTSLGACLWRTGVYGHMCCSVHLITLPSLFSMKYALGSSRCVMIFAR